MRNSRAASQSGILIVDPDVKSRAVLRELMEIVGYTVTAVAGAEEALEVLNPFRHRIILVENELPQFSGLELIREIRPLVPEAGIWVMIQVQDPLMVHEGESLGIAGWLFKPLNEREVLERITGWHRKEAVGGPEAVRGEAG